MMMRQGESVDRMHEEQRWVTTRPLRHFRQCWMILGGVLALLSSGGSVPVFAQISYTVFPAVPLSQDRPTGQPTEHDAPSVTLIVHDSTVKWVVDELTRQGHVLPMYYGSMATNSLLATRVTVHVVKVPLMDALATVLKGTGLVAAVAPVGDAVVIRPGKGGGAREHGQLAGGTITGHVTDSASGQGLGGAAVKIEGTKLATVTADSGGFTLKDVPPGDQVLSVKLFGFKPIERTVTVADSQRTTVRIILVPVPTVLSGVVTTAVGQQQRYQVGSDITVLNADSIQKVAPVSSITDMLETRVPGLIVQRTNGIPGAPSRLRLRGISSINMSSDPILIVDGVRVNADQSGSTVTQNPAYNGVTPGGGANEVSTNAGESFAGPSALDQIDPNSIETIEILKGPSATAIYGSDAATGVIVVTTKHGRAGPTRWSLSLDQGRTTLPGSWPTNYFLFGHEFLDQQNPLRPYELCDPYGPNRCVTDSVVAFQALNDPRYSPLTGQPGANHSGSLTVSGGSGALTYSVTGSAAAQSGYLHLPSSEVARFQKFHGFPAPGWMRTPDRYATYGATSQLTVQLGSGKGTLALTSSLFRGAQQQSLLQNDLTELSQIYVDTSQLSATPLFTNYYERAQLSTTTFNNAASLSNFAPWHWLPLTATAGLNVQDQNNSALLPRDYVTCLDVPNQLCGADSLGRFSVQQGTDVSGSLTIGTTLAQRMVTTAIGLNVYTVAENSYGATTLGLPIGVSVPTQFVYQGGRGPTYGTSNSATYGWYVQPTLNVSSRFFVSPGFRLDGGSNSGGKGGAVSGSLSLFPKIDLSWVAVQRPPSHPLWGALTLLRPRIAVGVAGIQPGPGERLRLLGPAQSIPVSSDGSALPTDILMIGSLGNPQLHAERDREVEGGSDVQLWNDRLSMTLTGYRKMAYDAILAIPVAPSALPVGGGGGATAVNIGTIQNTGMEATIFARLFDNRAVDWSMNANVARNRNLLVKLAPGVQQSTIYTGGLSYSKNNDPSFNPTYTNRIVPGYPLFGIWATPVLAFFDANHDGRIEPGEVIIGDSTRYVGAQQPNYELTFSTTISVLNDRLTFNTSIDYQNGLTQAITGGVVLKNLLADPSVSLSQQAAIVSGSGIGIVQTVNTLRWNTLSVSYLVPPGVARWLHLPTLSVALQGSNLGLFSKYRGADPNVNAFSSGNLTQDNGTLLPQPRVWNLHLTVGN